MNISKGGDSCGCSVDAEKLVARIKAVITNPHGVWDEIASEETTIKEVYQSYIVLLAAIPALGTFIGLGLFGPFGIVAQFVSSVVSYFLSLGFIYIAALILEKLAPMFEGNTNTLKGVKLMGYSSTPTYLAGVLSIIPPLSLLGLLFSLYSLYLYYSGIPKLTNVPESKRLVFFIVSLVAFLVCGIVLGGILIMFAPKMPGI